MQSTLGGSSRSQRSPPRHVPAGSASSADSAMTSQSSAPRSSSSSGRSQSSRTVVPDRQISQIEKSVTHLLVATKQLLETLTQWSRRQASENEVSDVYVRLGYEFNLACRAFNAIGVDTSDLGPVPDLLRTILEDTLSQDASPQSLDRYLPRIRDIIINLLHGLKKKQARLRSRQQREESRPLPGRQASSGSAVTNQMYEEATASSPKRPGSRRHGSNGSLEDQSSGAHSGSTVQTSNDTRGTSYSEREASRREAQQILSQPSQPETAISNVAMPSPDFSGYPTPPPPPLPPSRTMLWVPSKEVENWKDEPRGGFLPTRYRNIWEHQMVSPFCQHRILPSQIAVVIQRSTNRPQDAVTPSKTAKPLPSSHLAQGGEGELAKARTASPTESQANASVTSQIRPDKVPLRSEDGTIDSPTVAGKQPGAPQSAEEPSLAEAFEPAKDISIPNEGVAPGTPSSAIQRPSTGVSTPPQTSQFASEQPSPGKELTLFLQYKSKIKKYVLPEGYSGLTIGRLQLAFIEKFAWNTHNNGVDLPEIYIQDPISGVRHELEDLNDVKDRSVLVLNVDILDEVKKHFDDELGGVRRLIEGVKGTLEGQENIIQRVSDRQLEAAKEIARLAAAPPVSIPTSLPDGSARKGPITGSRSQLAELQSLKRDLAVLRQTYSNFSSDIASSMNAIRAKANFVKSAAADVAVPSYEGDAGRARVNAGKKELADESERLVGRVDDLQDLVEDLRKDVVSRGVRPLPRQLESVSKEISAVTKELKKMQEFLKREKPIWTKIWEKELQLVCEERDQLTMQEDLAADLEDDLEKAAQTFALVEQATKQQALQHNVNGGVALRNTSRNVVIDPAVDPMKAKDDVLGEVRALQPNHESRLEAIERAEKARQKELENRRIGLFQKELGAFVQEGKLKKSGGVEEAERQRRVKDDRIRKEVWERQQARAAEMEKAEAESAAAAAASTQLEQSDQSEQPEQPSIKDSTEDGTEVSTDNGDSTSKGEEKTTPSAQASAPEAINGEGEDTKKGEPTTSGGPIDSSTQ
ncbi:actin-interacting protein (Bud6/Aip3) [Aspergillus fumigatus Z5]|nr:actin-interacting protein (Bud6/Aip3) [Aspergillus fumigatus Z5]